MDLYVFLLKPAVSSSLFNDSSERYVVKSTGSPLIFKDFIKSTMANSQTLAAVAAATDPSM